MSKTLDAAKVAGYPYTDGGKLDVLGDEGIIPSGTKIIEENGTGIDVYNYAAVDVNVPQGVMVNESYDISEGTLTKGNITLEGDITAHIPDGVVTIGKTAFKNNNDITNVIMPDSIETIENGDYYGYDGDGAFYQCSKLKKVEFSNHLTSIGNRAFNTCTSLTSITIPDSVTSIGSTAFHDCTSLTSIVIPDSVTIIGNGAFTGCSGLTSITIPDSVTSIGGDAFHGCTSLTSITIPDSVTSIGSTAFHDCTSLTDIYYTGTQTEWEAITGISDAGIPEGATIHYEYTPE